MEKKLTNSGPLREPAGKHSIYTRDICQPRQMLPSSPDFHEPIGFFRILHGGQQLLRLTMDTIHQLLIGIGHPVTLQGRFSQPAQNASFGRMKSHSEDQQRSRLPDDFVLEDEL